MAVERHSFPEAELYCGQHKTMYANVELAVYTRDDDPYAEVVEEVNEIEYDDGVRVEGELFVDASIIYWPDRPALRRGVQAELVLIFEHESTRLNVLFTEEICVRDFVPKRTRRYFWHFVGIGRPNKDELEIYPAHYRGPKMKVFSVTNFRGLWPMGVAAVAVGKDQRDARRQLDMKLEAAGIEVRADYTLIEVDTSKPAALILQDGKF